MKTNIIKKITIFKKIYSANGYICNVIFKYNIGNCVILGTQPYTWSMLWDKLLELSNKDSDKYTKLDLRVSNDIYEYLIKYKDSFSFEEWITELEEELKLDMIIVLGY